MVNERRTLRGVAAAGAVAAAAVVGLLVWSGGSAPDAGAGDLGSGDRDDLPAGGIPEVNVAEGDVPATGSTPPADSPASAEATQVGSDALVEKLPDPPSVTPIGDLAAPDRPSWLLFDTPLTAARDEYAGALVSAGLSAAPGPVPPGASPATSVLVVTDPATGAQVLVVFEQLDTDVNITIGEVPSDYDATAPVGTPAAASPGVAALALLAALPVPESATELGAAGDMRTFQVSAVPYRDVVWAYLAQLQDAGYTVTETDRSEGLLTVAVTDAAGGTVTVDLLDHTDYTEIVACT